MADQMKAEEIRKAMTSSDMEEIAKTIEMLDENSKKKKKTYLSALVDRQRIGNARLTAAQPV